MFVLVLLAVAAMTFGCGGKDKGGVGDIGNQNKPASSDNSGSSKQAKNADEYATQFCGAVSKYADDINKLMNSDTNSDDPTQMKQMISDMVPLFQGLSKDLDKINPPDDAKEWHDGLVTGLSSAADLFGKMSDAMNKPIDEAMTDITNLYDEMSNMEDPFGSIGDPPAGYQDAFQNNAKCQELQNMGVFE